MKHLPRAGASHSISEAVIELDRGVSAACRFLAAL